MGQNIFINNNEIGKYSSRIGRSIKGKSPLIVDYKVKILVLLIRHKFKYVPDFKKYYNFFVFNNCKNK